MAQRKKSKKQKKQPLATRLFAPIRSAASWVVYGVQCGFYKICDVGQGRWGMALSWAAVAVVCGAAAWAYGPLRSHVSTLRTDPLSVVIAWPVLPGEAAVVDAKNLAASTYIPAEERDRLSQLAMYHLSGDLSPFNREALRDAGEALQKTGWFEPGSVVVWRGPNGVVHISGKWKVIAAAVRLGQQEWAVGQQGELLPLHWPIGGSGMRAIVGVSAAAPAFGDAWQDESLLTGLGLLGYLQAGASRIPAANRVWQAVDAVDVGGCAQGDGLRLRLLGASGAGGQITPGGEAIWGGSVGELSPGERPDEEKLLRLARLLDDPAWKAIGRPTADLRLPRVVLRVPGSPIGYADTVSATRRIR